MSAPANPWRGEIALNLQGDHFVLRPSFAALVAAEGELGPLFALVERAATGTLALSETVDLFWHCLAERPGGIDRDAFGERLTAAGLVTLSPALRELLAEILKGR